MQSELKLVKEFRRKRAQMQKELDEVCSQTHQHCMKKLQHYIGQKIQIFWHISCIGHYECHSRHLLPSLNLQKQIWDRGDRHLPKIDFVAMPLPDMVTLQPIFWARCQHCKWNENTTSMNTKTHNPQCPPPYNNQSWISFIQHFKMCNFFIRSKKACF